MGKSNYEKEQLLEQFSEDKIPEINDDPQDNYDNSSNDENDLSSQTRTLHKEVLVIYFLTFAKLLQIKELIVPKSDLKG
jgi:hypothetical protein